MLTFNQLFNKIYETFTQWYFTSNTTIISLYVCLGLLAIFAILIINKGFCKKALKGFKKQAKFINKHKLITTKNLYDFEKKCVNKMPKSISKQWRNFALIRNEKLVENYFNHQTISSINMEGKNRVTLASLDFAILIAICTSVCFFAFGNLAIASKMICIISPLVVGGMVRWGLMLVLCHRQNKLTNKFMQFKDELLSSVALENRFRSNDDLAEIKMEYASLNNTEQLTENLTVSPKLNKLISKVDEMLTGSVSHGSLKQIANMIISLRDRDYLNEDDKNILNVALGKICAKIA